MVNYLFGAALAAALVFQSAAESVSAAVTFRASTADEIEEGIAALSVDHAVKVLEMSNHTDKKTINLINGVLKESHSSSGHKKRSHQQHLQKDAPSTGADEQADYGGGLQSAMVRINEMMLQTIVHMDETVLECGSASRNYHHKIEELEEDVQYYQEVNTRASAAKLNARAQKNLYKGKIPIVQGELKDHNAQCIRELAELHRQLTISKNDMIVMDKVLNMTKCSDAATIDVPVVFLSCVNKRTGKKYKKMKATSEALKKELAKLKHPSSLRVMNKAISDNPHKVALVQIDRRLRGVQTKGPFDGMTFPGGGAVGQDGETPEVDYGVEVLNASDDPNLEQNVDECSSANISGSSFCPELRERFLNIAGGVSDTVEELQTMIENKQTRCDQIRLDLVAEETHYQEWFEEWEARHADYVAETASTYSQFKLKWKELENQRNLYDLKMQDCYKAREDAKSELCALHKIRGELATMSMWDQDITDCNVTDWDVPVCPVTCGGGVQKLTREITRLPGMGSQPYDRGHDCPPLDAQQSCNEFRCPVDCELSDWDEWSRCTVSCGGGVRERLRSIMVHPTPGGTPCELPLQTVQCNSGPCDEDCVLSDWEPWSSTCSKMCGGGIQTRIKTLVRAEIGSGTCPKFYKTSRYQEKACNTYACTYTNNVGSCGAKIDVMLVLDGSGSMGQEGFETMKTTASLLGGAIQGDSTLGALVYSSAEDTCVRLACITSIWREDFLREFACEPLAGWMAWQPSPLQCGIEWLSHLTWNKPQVLAAIADATWPGGGTLTSKALKACEIEMVNSRKDAPSIVIVLTDGLPYSPLHTLINAWYLKESGARLMMVPIGDEVADDMFFEELVSHPPRDNLLPVSSFEYLKSNNNTVNTVLTDFCTNYSAWTHQVWAGGFR